MTGKLFKVTVLLNIFILCALNIRANILEEISDLIERGAIFDAAQKINSISIDELENPIDKSHYSYLQGSIYLSQNNFSNAITSLEEGLTYLTQKESIDECEYINCLYALAYCNINIDNLENAEKWLRKAILDSKQLTEKCPIMIQIYDDLANVYIAEGKDKLADLCLLEKEKYINDVQSNNEIKELDAIWNEQFELILAYKDSGDWIQADALFESLLSSIDEHLGKSNDTYILYSFLYGNYLMEQFDGNNFETLLKAINLLEETLANAKIYKNKINEISSIYINLFTCYAWLNNSESIENLFDEAVSFYSQYDEGKHLPSLYLRTGESFWAMGNDEKAIKYLCPILLDPVNISSNNFSSVSMLSNSLYYNSHDKTEKFFNQTYDRLQELGFPEDDKLRIFYENALYLYRKLNEPNKARTCGEIAVNLFDKEKETQHLLYILSNLGQLVINEDIERGKDFFNKANSLFNESNLSALDRLISGGMEILSYVDNNLLDEAILIGSNILANMEVDEGNLPVMGNILHNLGRAYLLKNNYENAKECLIKSKEFQIKVEGKANERTLNYIQECETHLSKE